MSEDVQKKRSPWVYVGMGCGLALVMLCGLGAVLFFGVVKMGRDFAEDLNDPARRTSKAIKQANAILGAVPEGYNAAFSFGIPLLFDMVMFVDAPLLEDGGVPDFKRQFVFMRMMENDRSREMKAFFQNADAGTLSAEGLSVESSQEIGRGSFNHRDRRVSWVSLRGRMHNQMQQIADQDSLITSMLFECTDSGQVRIGTWQMRWPEGGVQDVSGTVADPAEMQKLLAPLSPCGK